MHSRWNFISTFTELPAHGDECWPIEVTSNTYFRGVASPCSLIQRRTLLLLDGLAAQAPRSNCNDVPIIKCQYNKCSQCVMIASKGEELKDCMDRGYADCWLEIEGMAGEGRWWRLLAKTTLVEETAGSCQQCTFSNYHQPYAKFRACLLELGMLKKSYSLHLVQMMNLWMFVVLDPFPSREPGWRENKQQSNRGECAYSVAHFRHVTHQPWSAGRPVPIECWRASAGPRPPQPSRTSSSRGWSGTGHRAAQSRGSRPPWLFSGCCWRPGSCPSWTLSWSGVSFAECHQAFWRQKHDEFATSQPRNTGC